MNTRNTTTPDVDRLRLSLRWLWMGPAGGLACMTILFAFGVIEGSAPMMMVSATTASALISTWVSVRAALTAQLARIDAQA
ncbi:MAG: hypothetical protein QM713_14145 [Arachnia sp.]